MPARPAMPPTAESKDARCALLAAIVKCWPTMEKFAAELGVDKSTVKRWLDGTNAFGWDTIYAALELAGRRWPAEMPRIFRLLASQVGAPVTVDLAATDAPSDHGDWVEELEDEAATDHAIHTAVRTGNHEALDAAIEAARVELDQQRAAGHQEIERRRGLWAAG